MCHVTNKFSFFYLNDKKLHYYNLDRDSCAGNNVGAAVVVYRSSHILHLINGEPIKCYGRTEDYGGEGTSTSIVNEINECGRVHDFLILHASCMLSL